MHGLVPPHPGPLTAIDLLGADLGITLALGVAVAIPTVIVAGPLFGKLAGRWVVSTCRTVEADDFSGNGGTAGTGTDESGGGTRTATGHDGHPQAAVLCHDDVSVLLPVALMMGKALVDIFIDDEENLVRRLRHTGSPADGAVDRGRGRHLHAGAQRGHDSRRDHQMHRDVVASCRRHHPDRGRRWRVQAGARRHRHRYEAGRWATAANVSVILLAWVLAVLIRLATGSATVATITASSLMLGLVEGMSTGEISLIVLAIGAGSLFFSHVNDAGFWLVKEYFGMSVGQTIKTWSIMETVLSVTGLVFVLLLGIVI